MRKLLAQLLVVALFAAVLIVSPYSPDTVDAQTADDASLVNVAVDGTASQSTTAFRGAAGRAIDGNTSGVWRQRSVTHTNPNDALPSWDLELAEAVTIDSIILWNRTNCCSSRLADFSVFISNSPFPDGATIAELETDPTVWSYSFDGVAGESVAIPVVATGQYVRVQKPSGTALSLAEVEIFEVFEETVPAVNVAVDGVASQSSTRSRGGVAGRAIDGNTSGVFAENSVTHTNAGGLQWWEVELTESTDIDNIVVWNRVNCCPERLADFTVFVSASAFADDATIAELEADPSVSSFSFDGIAGETEEFQIDTTGRYVRIQKPSTTPLSLAEVQIFGTPNTDVTRIELDARLIASSTASGSAQLSWDAPFDAVAPVSYEVRADGVVVGQTTTPVFDTTIGGETTFDILTTGADGAEFVSESVTLTPGTESGDCIAVGLNDGTTAITWESAPDGFLTLLDNNDGVYTPLTQFDDDPVNGHHYHVDSITTQAGVSNPDYRVVVANDDGTFRSQECAGSSFTPDQAERLTDIDFPVTPDGRIGRDMAGVSQAPVPISSSAPPSNLAPSSDPQTAPAACSAGGVYIDIVQTPVDQYQYVTLQVPEGVSVSVDLWSTKAGGSSSGNWAYSADTFRTNEDGTRGAILDGVNNSTPFYWRNSIFPDSFEERYYQQDDRVLFTAPETGTYLLGIEILTKVRIDEADDGAATVLDNIQFVDDDGNALTAPCAVDELFKCQVDGGDVYVAEDYSYQSSVAIDGVPTDLGPGCYSYDHCGSSPYTGIIDDVAVWACENEELLDAALDVAVATFVIAGMIYIGPVIVANAGAIGAGAALGGAMSFWTCDQSENGWWKPSTDLDGTCVATEIALGAVFGPIAGNITGSIGRKIAVACGWGALEGATSTIAHMTFVDEGEAFDASDALVGAGIGCSTAGALTGLGRAARRAITEIRDTGRLVGGGSGSWVDDALAPVRYIAGSTQSAPGSCVSKCGEILSGGRMLEAELLDELGEFSTPSLLREQLGDGWETAFFSPAEAVTQAQRGALGAVLQTPIDARHMVVVTPRGNDVFEVLDPYDGSVYPVDTEWIAKYVSEGIWFVG